MSKKSNHNGDIVNDNGVNLSTVNKTYKKATDNHGNNTDPNHPNYTPPKKTK